MCEGATSGHRELWEAVSVLPADLGPEDNVAMRREAEELLDYLCTMHQEHANEAVLTALADCYNRCVEERRRAQDLLELHERWGKRRIGGVAEPGNPVRDRPAS